MKKIFWFIIKYFNLGRYVNKLIFINKINNYLKYQFFQFISIFVKRDDKLVIMSSYSGTKYDDSPKIIYEYLKSNPEFYDYKIFWAFKNPKEFEYLTDVKKLKTNTFEFYYKTLKSKYFISNAQIGEGFYFKGKRTIYLNTWHGSAIKKIGIDRNPKYKNWIFQGKHLVDFFCAQSKFDQEILSRAFQIDKHKVILTGLPRNDELKNGDFNIRELKDKLGVPLDKKIILYAPTYRNYDLENCLDYVAKPHVNFSKWKAELGDEYVVLFRSHYYISKLMVNDIDEKFVYDVSNYPFINELILVSDILISDYSSLFFDYSITEKPMLCYAYDLEEYKEKVGIYIDIENELPNGVILHEDDLLTKIKSLNISEEVTKTKKFRDKYIELYGNATENVVNFLLSLN